MMVLGHWHSCRRFLNGITRPCAKREWGAATSACCGVASPLINFVGSRIDTVVEGANDVHLTIKCEGDELRSPGRWQAVMHRQRILERADLLRFHLSAAQARDAGGTGRTDAPDGH